MMASPSETYLELLALTRQYLLQEHTPNERLYAESESYHYFRDLVVRRQGAKTTAEITPPSTPVAKTSLPQPTPMSKPVHQTPVKANIAAPVKKPPLPLPTPPLPLSTGTEPKKPPKENGAFTLEPMARAEPVDMEEIRKLVSEKLPGFVYIDQIPDDTEARRLARSWEQAKQAYEVLILSFDEPPKAQAFLNNIARALNAYGIPATVMRASKIEQDNDWKNLLGQPLKMVMASSYGIDALPGLAKQHREEPRQAKHFLGNVPLLLLSDVGFYLREPSLKASLWAAILKYVA